MPKKYKYTTSFTFQGHRYKVRADTLMELGEKKARKIEQLKRSGNIVSGDMTLSDWAKKCVETYKVTQSEATREPYLSRLNHCVLEPLGTLQLKKIKPIHCQNALNLQAGKSASHINAVYGILRFLFRHAYDNNLIPADPTQHLVKPPAKKAGHRRALTPIERKYFVRVGLSDRLYYFFMLMLFCGCRPGEARGAQGRDLFRKDGINFLHIRGTKNASADRNVPVPDILWDRIKDTPPYEHISVTSTGRPVHAQNARRIWDSLCKQINIAMGCKTHNGSLIPPYPLATDLVPYCLRHEYCTNLARCGVDIRIAQKLMGHSNIKMTANIYTNLTDTDLAPVLDAINGKKDPECDTQRDTATSKR